MSLKVGIYVDSLNITMNGGYGIRYDALHHYAERDGYVLRANAYLAEDRERKKEDNEYRARVNSYHRRLRQCGFKVLVIPIARYTDEDGQTFTKANVDMDLALDVIQQAQHLDKILILSGDGDFTRLVELVQNYGTRVEVLAFQSVSSRLASTADVYHNGFLVPGLLPTESEGMKRGYVARFNRDKGFGFLRYYDESFAPQEVFFHVTEVLDSGPVSLDSGPTPIFEFQTETTEEGRERAVNMTLVSTDWNL